MADSWATEVPSDETADFAVGSDLHLELSGTGGVRASLMSALRDAVRSGRLAPGTRLPSSRSLASDLDIARNTVADAYAELVAEGWLTARQGSGTRVAERAVACEIRREPPAPVRRPTVRPAPTPVYDLMPGSPDVSSFPRASWLTAARKALTNAPNDAFGYGTHVAGRPELRRALADYLARARGVRAAPERILICSGLSEGLRLVGEVLGATARMPGAAPGADLVAVESFGLDIHRDLLTGCGLRTVAVGFDEQGPRTEELAATRARAVLLTPAHQFPFGVALPPERRAAAVKWAVETGGVVLEDDYDGEFRYDGQRVGAVQGLDPEHVVYMGTASKSLSPALRLGWLVLPERLFAAVAELKRRPGFQTSGLDQLTLAEFIASGAYDRHVRGMRQRYQRRRDQLIAALAERAPHIKVGGIAAGLHAVLELPAGTEQSVINGAAWQGLALDGLRRYRLGAGTGGDAAPYDDVMGDALVVGYGTPPDHAYTGALDALCRALP
ncbi:MocR-like pyridoxine biosynthesis transcription factor PdxR [Streptomyces zagrosensis]|uniref:GntR family transcriptional regulator/MocR family aminotransferase n=1 Tax=Streptomyces zagrosensis TaxID=1042984 RepID=A0A7W9UYG9_9ACTN|nr:PLP-dependent aminotransferase family protein [Streptomyces zagrosensis]MBB5934784.1 GntR family transcriptional regulator/MocR family aminotransferase [Streptomyces zagrosensis]